MGGSLSQDEIDALLNGGTSPAPDTTPSDSGQLSQADIDALLGGDSTPPDGGQLSQANVDAIMNSTAVPANNEEFVASTKSFELDGYLNNDQKDALGEIGNISMGTSATTLNLLLQQKVLITTPRVSVVNWNDLAESYDRPCVGIRVDYKEGIEGSNVLVLRQKDVKIITDLMMGGTGEVDDDFELTEIDLSAIGEAMNQMVGSSSTSLSQMLGCKIDIDTPQAFILSFKDDSIEKIGFADEIVACTAFRMQIGNLIDSEIMQILPVKFAIEMINTMMGMDSGPAVKAEEPKAEPEPVISTKDTLSDDEISKLLSQETVQPQVQVQPQVPVQPQAPVQPQDMTAQPYPYPYPPYPYPYPPQQAPVQPQNVSPVSFPEFVSADSIQQQKKNIQIIENVPLEITVELGRTHKLIKEILDFSPGTIIELDKIAGEPIDILVNGKFIAKGEVVVIDENFGIRITDIINSEDRI